MKILVTGSYGQLGNEMQVEARRHKEAECLFTDADTLDICDKDALERRVAEEKPDYIVNCAAYTAVDKAEDDEAAAHKVNVDAVRNIGETAARHGVKVIHVSTDYVFDGNGHLPYTEDMPVAPTNVYGRTKLAGERALLEADSDAIIIRTAWLYSSFGNNFVKTMLRLGRERSTLGVVFDQIGSPTYAADLAKAIFTVICSGRWTPGIYHFSNEGVCSWYDFTKAIHEAAGITTCDVKPIESSEYKYRTPRPSYSVLNKRKIKEVYGVEVPYWVESLRRCIGILEGKQTEDIPTVNG